MRRLFAILFVVCCSAAMAQQPDYGSLSHSIADFDKALESRDSVALKWLLHEKTSYGHSNGWVETKREVIEDLYNGKLVYKKIAATKPDVKTSGTVASARSIADIDAVLDGKFMSFKLKVLQVWLWENDHWTLFARQSVPVAKEK
ncbi:MAG: nuclear transport factor 2 family protein [Chitinophagaceae bacterium]|nr:nuclear transport factor 2 family protein [Chitinophagaceae bacterium]